MNIWLKICAAITLLAILSQSDVRAANEEHIIVSGGVSLMQWEQYKREPHDKWWLNFIRAARIRVEDIRNEFGPDAKITWKVYAPAYKRRMREEPKAMFDIIQSVQQAYGVRLVYFSSGGDIINYLNNGQPRDQVKVRSFHFFGHSNKACFMFDYSNEIDSASKAWLHEDELGQIRRGIFTSNADVVSWGCHTGESMSSKWRQATGVSMRGAVGKTLYQTNSLPILSPSSGVRWSN